MSHGETREKIDELVAKIQSQEFTGTPEEQLVKMVLYFDEFVKEHIDYGFESVEFEIKRNNGEIPKDSENPYYSQFLATSFFDFDNNGMTRAVCGSISSVAKDVFSKLEIDGQKIGSEYVYGKTSFTDGNKSNYLGHRWNVFKLNEKDYMVDFTTSMMIHNIDKEGFPQYRNFIENANLDLTPENDMDCLLFDELIPIVSIGGFDTSKGGHDEFEDPKDLVASLEHDVRKEYPNITKIPPEKLKEIREEMFFNKKSL